MDPALPTSPTTGGWRDEILKEFTPAAARLTLVADPDALLTEERILQSLRERGFELIPFDDPVAFRFAYESKYRAQWDRGELTDLVVVLRAQRHDLDTLPYDLLQAGRKLSFSLGQLFPNLSYPIVDALDRADLDALFQAQTALGSEKLGDNGTKDFILRHVFSLVPESIREPSDLLRALLRRHYSAQRIPPVLEQRLAQVLRHGGRFADWPLEQIIADRATFFAFLQERWPVFLDRTAARKGKTVREAAEHYSLRIPGPADLPLDHQDVRVYIDTLFMDGILRPVPHEEAEGLLGKWVEVGVRSDPQADGRRRIDRLAGTLDGSVPGTDSRHPEWLAFALRWGELLAAWRAMEPSLAVEVASRLQPLRSKVDAAFDAWMLGRFGSLHNLPAARPAMLHHIPRYLAQVALGRDPACKVALVVVDGLAVDQWVVIRQVLGDRRPEWRFEETGVFAWVPTVTPVSRQAVFSGRAPIYLPSSLQTTDREGALWSRFWAERGLAQAEVGYLRGLGEGQLGPVEEVLSRPNLRALGLVVDKVDRIMHGMKLGAAGMHGQVRLWAEEGWLAALLDLLLARGFAVFLTSDHGNVEATGCGRLSEGVIADRRGERARVYSSPLLRKQASERVPASIEWPPVGLPADYLPLLAPDRAAFVPEGERVVAHGGISLEEVIVPLVRIMSWREKVNEG